jgi:hypothetical protein
MQSETLLSEDGTSTVGLDTMNVDSSTNVSLGEEEEVDEGRSNDRMDLDDPVEVALQDPMRAKTGGEFEDPEQEIRIGNEIQEAENDDMNEETYYP